MAELTRWDLLLFFLSPILSVVGLETSSHEDGEVEGRGNKLRE